MIDKPYVPEKTTVLLVDDTVDDLILIEGLLEEYYRIRTATNGEMALKIARTEPKPDLILLDIVMPGLDGYEVCRQLKGNAATRHIPIIFLTSKSGITDETKGLELGAIDYIKKPISPPILLARVKTHLNVKLMQDFLLNIVEFSPEAILVADETDGSILLFNSQVERLFGYNADEIVSQKIDQLISSTNGIRKDGSEFPIEIKSSYLPNLQKQSFNLCFLIRDVTEMRENEANREQYRRHLEELVEKRTSALSIAKEAAEAANVAKSVFIATMSHELRTPLNAILGFSELMSLDQSATPKQKEILSIINRSGVHLLGMINDVLDISKIEAGRFELTIQGFDLVHFLEEIFTMFSERVKAKQLDFALEIAANIPQFIKADSGKLRQVLINLLGNAIKFTHQGSIKLRATSQPLNDAMAMLTVEVIDSGVGISADKQAEVFQPFTQVMQANLDTQGTGLGLVISKSLLKLMDGDICVESELGKGSTFKIEVPVTLIDATEIAIEQNSRAVKSLAPNQPNWRLLVVDDNADNRLLLVSILTNMNFQVREAENGQEAILAFEQWQPHLIWMDMRMPVLDGYEATKRIRKLASSEQVKILALTASSLKEQRQDIINAGCDDVLHKPFQLPQIVAALVKHLGVKFIYQESEVIESLPTVEITPEMIALLPLELRQQLHEAVLLLDTEAVEVVISNIHLIAPETAAALAEMAKNYQFQLIDSMLSEAAVCPPPLYRRY